MDALPAEIGRYEVKGFIARGGMGTLYLASDPVLQRQVAIKLLRDADNDELRARFTREARAAANLRHRNIVTIFDVGDHNGQPFMAMEYIHGQTLGSLISSDPPPSTIRRLQLIEDLCDGLAYAHTRGVIHRDIKPANLMVDGEGTLKILDFGIARAAAESGMTQAGLLVGTLNYMSPEQVAGAPIDGRSDMFAVGAVMYELLTRRQAFPGSIDGGVLNRILHGEPDPLEQICPYLDPELGRIVRRALEKPPASRFPDLQQMRTDIAHVRQTLEASTQADADETVAVVPQQTTRMTPTPVRRGTDREEIARRRAQQIDEHIAAARQALSASAYDDVILRCEHALLLDPNESRALDLAERARLLRDEAAAREWLEQAQQHLRTGGLTEASHCVREALALTPESPQAVEMGRVVAEARLVQERERQRAAALQSMLARGQAALERGDLEAAIVASDEALAAAPAHDEARRLKEQAQQAIAERERQRRDAEAQQAAGEARHLFAQGQHAEALALLEEFWPAHPIVSHAWTELRAQAARLESERDLPTPPIEAPATVVAPPEPEVTVFAPRGGGAVAPAPEPPVPPASAAVDRTMVAPPQPASAPAPPGRAAVASPGPPAPGSSPWLRYAAAAMVVLAVAAALLFLFRGGAPAPDEQVANVEGNTAAGTAVEPLPDNPFPAFDPPAPETPNQGDPAAGAPADSGKSAGRAGDAAAPAAPAATPDRQQAPRPAPDPPAPPPPPRPAAQPSVTPAETPRPETTPAPTPPPVPPAETAPPRTSDTARVPEPEPEPDPPPAPTPPPREPAREAAPAPQPVSDDQLIRGTLDAYAEAYRRLDVAAVQRVFPTVDRATLQRGFAQADSQEVQISDIRIEVAGNRATVRCRVFQRIDLKAGNEGTVNEQTVFQMEKRGDRWVIVRRSAS